MTEESEVLTLKEGCPLDKVLKFLSSEWTAHIVWTLGRNGEMRFGALRRALPGDISARVLSTRLKQLVAMGLIHRNDVGSMPPHVIYSLTTEGKQVDALLVEFAKLFENMRLPFAVQKN
ncbi:MAG: helix-turn-helix domain-containing protein [Hyphomicrobiales bacterium]|nr:helix-turn-helix domain-containing protein [Hyphomicrobiales bacterium]